MIRSISYTILAILVLLGFGQDIEGIRNIAYAVIWTLLAFSVMALRGDIIESLAEKPTPPAMPGWLMVINGASFFTLLFCGAWWTALAFGGHFVVMSVVISVVDEAKAMRKAATERKEA